MSQKNEQSQEQSNSKSAVLGLQHLLAMYSGSILVPIMIAGALNYSATQLTYLISADIFMCGLATFLQLQLRKHFGIGLPVVLGVAFQSVAPLIIIGQRHGSGAMFGSLMVAGVFVILVSGIFSKIRKLFPPIVTGSVITTIGLSLIPVAIGNMGNNVDKPTIQSLILAISTIVIILLINIFTTGFIRSIAILIGLIAGTILAASMGLVDFSVVSQAPWAHLPQPFYFSAGATMVMVGSLFAAHEESPGQTVERDGQLFKEYFGSASEYQKGEHKNVEGKKILLPHKGSLKDTLKEMEEDLQSSISYAGGRDLSALTKVDYVVVKNSIWNGDAI